MKIPDLSALFGEHRIYLLNRSATYAIGVAETVPMAGILSMDSGAEYAYLSERLKTEIACWDPRPGWRISQPDASIDLALPALEAGLCRMLQSDSSAPNSSGASLWCPRHCRSSRDFAERLGMGIINPLADITEMLADKRQVLPALRDLGLPTLPGDWLTASSASYADCARRFGLPFVLQTRTSDSGAGTTIVREEADYLAACRRFSGEELWVAPFATDLSVNINACVTAEDVFVAYPSVQLTGFPFLNAAPPRYCGNDYAASARLSKTNHRDLAGQTYRIGKWLASLGFEGVFGLDYVMGRDGRFCPVDLNPRWQGSTALLAQAEQISGRIPLPVLGLAAHLGLFSRTELCRFGETCAEPVNASQFFLLAPNRSVLCGRQVRPGIHSLAPEFHWQRDGYHLADLVRNDEVLLGGAIIPQGIRVEAQVPVLRVFRRGAVLNDTLAGPLPWVARAADALYTALDLQDTDDSL